MLNLYYKLFFKVRGSRLVRIKRNIIVSKSLRHGDYGFWYIDSKNKFRITFMGNEPTKQSALFRFKILMNR